MSNFKQIATATINYIPLNNGYLPKCTENAIPQIKISGKDINNPQTKVSIEAFYKGGNPVGQTDYFLLNNFTALTTPEGVNGPTSEDRGVYQIDWHHSGAVWKCPALRRRLDYSSNQNRLGLVYAPAQEDPGSDKKIGRITWSVFNYGKSRTSTSSPEVKYGNLHFPVGYEQIPMIAELCAKTRGGEGSDIPTGPHDGNYAVAFLDGHVESYIGEKGYLHWCVGCKDDNESKYTAEPKNGVIIQ